MGIISVLVALLVPVVGKSRASAQSITCLSQLRQIGAGFLQYAADNEKCLPDPFAAQKSWEQLLRPYLGTADVFRCGGDTEIYPMVGSSYDWRDTGRYETTLAGRLITDVDQSNCVLAFEALPSWHAAGRMNAVFLNGSAQAMEQETCMADILRKIRAPQADNGRAE